MTQTLAVLVHIFLTSQLTLAASHHFGKHATHDKFAKRFRPAVDLLGRGVHEDSFTQRDLTSNSTSLEKRDLYKGGDGKDYNVLHKGVGDNTYYWDTAATPDKSVCYPKPGTWVFAESTALTLCESVVTSLQKTMAEKGDLKMVAIQRELLYNDWSLCGKEVVISATNAGTGETKDFGNYIVWDGCEKCNGGVDLSVPEFKNIWGDNGCTDGRYHNVEWRILDHQIPGPAEEPDKWQPRKIALGTSDPAYVDKYSGCPTADLGRVTCSQDGKALGICSVDSWGGPATLGRYEMYWTQCAGGTFCDPNGAGAGYAICISEAQAQANAFAGIPPPGKCDGIPIGGYRCTGDKAGKQICTAGTAPGSASWGTVTQCAPTTTCEADTIALGVANCIVAK